MTSKWIETIERILNRQREIRKEGSVAWYRGHRNANWKLYSTLHRHAQFLMTGSGLKLPPDDAKSLLRDVYKTLYRRFLSDAWPLLDAKERSDWGVVFAMQHYGLPTRLLDWTESFLCALHFAHVDRVPGDEAAIYILDPQKLNQQSVKQDGLIHTELSFEPAILQLEHWHPKYKAPDADLTTIAIAPIFTNERMLAQRSGFTVSGDTFAPLDEQSVSKNALDKIVLSDDTFEDVEAYLELAGVNAFNFFPDREGLKMKHQENTRSTIKDAKKFYAKSK